MYVRFVRVIVFTCQCLNFDLKEGGRDGREALKKKKLKRTLTHPLKVVKGAFRKNEMAPPLDP